MPDLHEFGSGPRHSRWRTPPVLIWLALSAGAHASMLLLANRLAGGDPTASAQANAGADSSELELRLAPAAHAPRVTQNALIAPRTMPAPLQPPQAAPQARHASRLPPLQPTHQGPPTEPLRSDPATASAITSSEDVAPVSPAAPPARVDVTQRLPQPIALAAPVLPLALAPDGILSASPSAAADGTTAAPVKTTDPLIAPRYAAQPPDYPLAARRAGLEGVVRVRVHIAANGQASGIYVQTSSGHAVLDTAACEAVAHWVFTPAQRDGHPVAVSMDLPVRFRLADSP